VQPESSRELSDETLAEEIALLGVLILAVSGVTRHLTHAEVDQVLELDRALPSAPLAPSR
jgi:hypothetical protein